MPKSRADQLYARWSDEVLQCRVVTGHHWANTTARKLRGGFEQDQACRQCPRKRTIVMDNRGRPVGYRYSGTPAGYSVPPGTGPLTADEKGQLRLWALGLR